MRSADSAKAHIYFRGGVWWCYVPAQSFGSDSYIAGPFASPLLGNALARS
jgi:hypothetical protein